MSATVSSNNRRAGAATAIAALAAFNVYSCMYAFRKPYSAATYSEFAYWGLSLKVWLVLAQTLGYAVSKFIGIRYISELNPQNRLRSILGLIGTAWLALLGFALVPPPWNIIFLFVNGIPLGLVFGIVFSYLEGRRNTEFLGAALACSFIFSSGLVKSIGKWLLINFHMNEFWMPFATGALFVLPTLLFGYLLERIPAPSDADRLMRSERRPMYRKERMHFLKQFRFGIIMMVVTYLLLTLLRDLRDNFAAEVWTELGYGNDAAIFTATEIPVSLLVLGLISLLVFVKNNFKALIYNHVFIISGFLISIFSTIFYQWHWISAPVWFAATGLGLYLAYVPFNCLLFDRMLANFKYPGNVGFLMYLADAIGYLGSVSILFIKEFWQTDLAWGKFIQEVLLVCGVIGGLLMLLSSLYFIQKNKAKNYAKSKT